MASCGDGIVVTNEELRLLIMQEWEESHDGANSTSREKPGITLKRSFENRTDWLDWINLNPKSEKKPAPPTGKSKKPKDKTLNYFTKNELLTSYLEALL